VAMFWTAPFLLCCTIAIHVSLAVFLHLSSSCHAPPTSSIPALTCTAPKRGRRGSLGGHDHDLDLCATLSCHVAQFGWPWPRLDQCQHTLPIPRPSPIHLSLLPPFTSSLPQPQNRLDPRTLLTPFQRTTMPPPTSSLKPGPAKSNGAKTAAASVPTADSGAAGAEERKTVGKPDKTTYDAEQDAVNKEIAEVKTKLVSVYVMAVGLGLGLGLA
jgi:hypothetical protein